MAGVAACYCQCSGAPEAHTHIPPDWYSSRRDQPLLEIRGTPKYSPPVLLVDPRSCVLGEGGCCSLLFPRRRAGPRLAPSEAADAWLGISVLWVAPSQQCVLREHHCSGLTKEGFAWGTPRLWASLPGDAHVWKALPNGRGRLWKRFSGRYQLPQLIVKAALV